MDLRTRVLRASDAEMPLIGLALKYAVSWGLGRSGKQRREARDDASYPIEVSVSGPDG